MSQEILNFLLTACQKVSNFFCELNPQQSVTQKSLYGCDDIDPRHKLAAALRWFAGGSYSEICLIHAMSKQSVYKCVWAAVAGLHQRIEQTGVQVSLVRRRRTFQ